MTAKVDLDDLGLDEAERERLHEACRVLGTSYREFLKIAAMQAVDEVLGVSNYVARR